MPRQRNTSSSPQDAQSYRHPDADLPVRPEIGAQAHFKMCSNDLSLCCLSNGVEELVS